MNFGYPFTPYAANMGQEQYMGNVGTNPNMANMGMDYMPQQAMGSGCGCGSQTMDYMAQQPMAYGMQGMGFGQPGCNQVVQQTCAVDMPYYVNYNTHAVSNLHYIKLSKNAQKWQKNSDFWCFRMKIAKFLSKNC